MAVLVWRRCCSCCLPARSRVRARVKGGRPYPGCNLVLFGETERLRRLRIPALVRQVPRCDPNREYDTEGKERKPACAA